MRNLLIVALATVIFGSCCTKEDCVVNEGTKVKLYGFSSNEVDSVEVKAYLKNTVLTSITDSFMYKATAESDYHTIPYSSFVQDRDYMVIVHQASKEYKITNIGTEEITCGSCKSDRTVYEDISYYYVNGSINRSKEIVINK